MSKHPIFVSSSRGAPSVLPVYKVDANNKDRVKRGGGLLGSVIFVFFSTLIFIFFFVSIYWGTTFLQTHVDEENSLIRGLPGTRNVIRKWSKKTLSGFDITELGNPPGKHSYHTDDPAAFSEEEEAEEAEEEEEEDAEEISAQEAEADAEAEEGEFIEGEVIAEEEEEVEGEPLQDIGEEGEEGEEEFISSGDDARAREGEQEQEQEEEAEEEAEAGEEEQEQ
jgi:hypothetical protein